MARSVMVAVAGDSGTGKAALGAGLRAIFGEERCAEVSLDGYFALDRAQRNAVGLSPLDPRAHDFAAMDEDLWRLSHGEPVTKPVYDHTRGATNGTETIEPREIVIVQGRFPLYTHALRALFTTSVWLERAAGVTLPWTIHRDVTQSGHPEDRVRTASERRRADYERYVAPQAQHADVRLAFHADRVVITQRDASALAGELLAIGSGHLRAGTDGARDGATSLVIDNAVDDATVRSVEASLRARLGGRPGSDGRRAGSFTNTDGSRTSNELAIVQLVVAARIAAASGRARNEVGATV